MTEPTDPTEIEVVGQASIAPSADLTALAEADAAAEAEPEPEREPVVVDLEELASSGLTLDPSAFNANQMMRVESALNCDFERAVQDGLSGDKTLLGDDGRIIRFGEVTRAMMFAYLVDIYPGLTIQEAGNVPFSALRPKKAQPGEGKPSD